MIIVIHSASLLSALAAIYILDKKAGLTNLIALGIFIINIVFISVVIA
jgi:hypothetical protein